MKWGRRTDVGSLCSARIDRYHDATLEDEGEGGSSVQHLDGLSLALSKGIGQERARLREMD
jgi:hypothetical protein